MLLNTTFCNSPAPGTTQLSATTRSGGESNTAPTRRPTSFRYKPLAGVSSVISAPPSSSTRPPAVGASRKNAVSPCNNTSTSAPASISSSSWKGHHAPSCHTFAHLASMPDKAGPAPPNSSRKSSTSSATPAASSSPAPPVTSPAPTASPKAPSTTLRLKHLTGFPSPIPAAAAPTSSACQSVIIRHSSCG